MTQYPIHAQLDTPIAADADMAFRGFDSYQEPENLPMGMLQTAQDIRMEGNRAKVRKGWDFQAELSGMSPTYTYSGGDEQVWASGNYSDPDDGNKDWLVAATKTKAVIWTASEQLYVNYYNATLTAGSVHAGADTLTISSHSFQTGDAVQVSTDDTLPAGLSAGTTYWVIDASSSSIQLATTYANAKAGTQIDITDQGAGNHTVQNVLDSTMTPTVVQAFNQVYILRYKARPLVWDGATAATGDVVTSTFNGLDASASGAGDPFPDTDYGIYFRNRLWGIQPADVATPTLARTGAQIVVASDLLAPNNITSADSEFYMNYGAADWTVGFSTYLDNSLIVFNRRSVRMLTNAHATNVSEHFPVTDRYGCAARRTIAQGGGYIFFLSDEGVMTLSAAQDSVTGMGLTVSKLQGATTPLSQSIQDEINDIDMTESVVKSACGVIWDNKYYLAVQLTGGSSQTTVFVYDIINEAWVSKDTYPEGIEGWVKVVYSQKVRLFATLPKGWFLMEENAGLDDTNRSIGASGSDTAAITAKIKTRNYTLGTQAIKHFNRVQIGANVANGDSFTIKTNSTDPDVSTTQATHTATGSEESTLRYGVRQRGYSCNVEVDVTAGSPEFRYIQLSGTTQEQVGSRREVS